MNPRRVIHRTDDDLALDGVGIGVGIMVQNPVTDGNIRGVTAQCVDCFTDHLPDGKTALLTHARHSIVEGVSREGACAPGARSSACMSQYPRVTTRRRAAAAVAPTFQPHGEYRSESTEALQCQKAL